MLQYIRDGERIVVRLSGELDHCCAQSVRRDLDMLLRDTTIRMMILDFTSLTFMDSSGIGVILGRYRKLRDRGGSLSVIHMNRHVGRIFHMSGMDRIIKQLDKQEVQA